jgi:hypothetical protein
LLHLTSGILRCESSYRAELSDFCGIIVPQNDRDADPMFVMVNQIPFGKTNHGRVLQERKIVRVFVMKKGYERCN